MYRKYLNILGAIHSTKLSGNFGPKLNGSVRSNRKSFGKTGLPSEVVLFSRSDRLEFWLNVSRPLFSVNGRCRWNENLTQCYSIASSPARTSSLGHFSCAFLFISQPFFTYCNCISFRFFKKL